jgi:hypothetical protein
VAVTERHYARYMAIDGYQNPYIVPEGCLPPDLIQLIEAGKLAGVTTASLSVTKVSN